MAKLTSPTGTELEAPDHMVDSLLSQGYTNADEDKTRAETPAADRAEEGSDRQRSRRR